MTLSTFVGAAAANGFSVAFEDETDRTAADYNVVSVGEPPSYVREMSESQSSASMVAFPLRIANPCSHPQLDLYASSSNALLSPEDLSARQKLSNFNEAFLLRRFRGTLGPLVTPSARSVGSRHIANHSAA